MKQCLAISVLMLVLAYPALAETAFADGWEPARVVDGMIVSAGVTDEQAKGFAAQHRQAQEVRQAEAAAYWAYWHQQNRAPSPIARSVGPPISQPQVSPPGTGRLEPWLFGTGGTGKRIFGDVYPRMGPDFGGGMDAREFAREQDRKYRWETGQYSYPDWVLTK